MGKKLVLLAEDNLDVREALEEYLESCGYDVIPAGTGKQALDFLTLDDRSPPDVVVLDLMMPIVTGWQVLEEMRRDPRLATVPVIVLTGAERDRPVGAAAVLRKPTAPEALRDTISDVLETRADGGFVASSGPG
jgi:CheY-like chemotaxis protein